MSSILRQLFGLAALISLVAIVRGQEQKSKLSPVILIPGLGGSPLEARGQFGSFKSLNWTTVWVDYAKLRPSRFYRLAKTMDLDINPINGSSTNKPGLEVRVKKENDVRSVEYLTDHKIGGFNYYGTMVDRLVRELGYVRDVNIRGAPYDFRRAPNELGEFYDKLEHNVQQMKNETGMPVTIICHSMGCLNAWYFLKNHSAEWKEENIKRLIALAAPWGGSPMALKSHAVGFAIDIPRLSRLAATFPSMYLLLPNEQVFGDKVLAVIDKGNNERKTLITAQNLESYLKMSKIPVAVKLWKMISPLMGKLEAPQVETHCFYGDGVRTLDHFRLSGPDASVVDKVYDNNGDGTVPALSGRYCETWADNQSQQVSVESFIVKHRNMVTNRQVIDSVMEILRKDIQELRRTKSLPIPRSHRWRISRLPSMKNLQRTFSARFDQHVKRK